MDADRNSPRKSLLILPQGPRRGQPSKLLDNNDSTLAQQHQRKICGLHLHKQTSSGEPGLLAFQRCHKVLWRPSHGDVRECQVGNWDINPCWPETRRLSVETKWGAWNSTPTVQQQGTPLPHPRNSVRECLVKSQTFHHCSAVTRPPPAWGAGTLSPAQR